MLTHDEIDRLAFADVVSAKLREQSADLRGFGDVFGERLTALKEQVAPLPIPQPVMDLAPLAGILERMTAVQTEMVQVVATLCSLMQSLQPALPAKRTLRITHDDGSSSTITEE